MRELRKRHRVKRWLYSNTAVIILLILAVLVWQGVWGVYQKEQRSAASLSDVKSKEERLEQRKEELQHEIARLKTREGKEEEVREKFNVVKEGERVVVLVDPPDATTTPTKEKDGFIERTWGAVVDWFR